MLLCRYAFLWIDSSSLMKNEKFSCRLLMSNFSLLHLMVLSYFKFSCCLLLSNFNYRENKQSYNSVPVCSSSSYYCIHTLHLSNHSKVHSFHILPHFENTRKGIIITSNWNDFFLSFSCYSKIHFLKFIVNWIFLFWHWILCFVSLLVS